MVTKGIAEFVAQCLRIRIGDIAKRVALGATTWIGRWLSLTEVVDKRVEANLGSCSWLER